MYESRYDPESATILFYFEGAVADADWDRHVGELRSFWREASIRPKPIATMILVEGDAARPSPKIRAAIADATAPYTGYAACVTKSVIIRGVVTALNWLRPPKHTVQTFEDTEAAFRWLDERRGGIQPLRDAVRAVTAGRRKR